MPSRPRTLIRPAQAHKSSAALVDTNNPRGTYHKAYCSHSPRALLAMGALKRIATTVFAPVISVGRAYNNIALKAPWTTGVVTTVVKTSAADIFAQKVIERRDDIDWRRNGVFTFFGFAYLGCFQYWLYNDLFVRICRPITRVVGHMGSAPVKTFIDQCIHHPLFYFPAFYICKGAAEGRPLDSVLEKYQSDLWENCKALWTVWVPAQLVNFAVVPLHLRLPFVAGVSFAWTVIISVMRGSLEAHMDQSIEASTAWETALIQMEQMLAELPLDPAETPAAYQHEYYHLDYDYNPLYVDGSDAEGSEKGEQAVSGETAAQAAAAKKPSLVHTLSASELTAGAAAAVLGGRVPGAVQ